MQPPIPSLINVLTCVATQLANLLDMCCTACDSTTNKPKHLNFITLQMVLPAPALCICISPCSTCALLIAAGQSADHRSSRGPLGTAQGGHPGETGLAPPGGASAGGAACVEECVAAAGAEGGVGHQVPPPPSVIPLHQQQAMSASTQPRSQDLGFYCRSDRSHFGSI